MNNTFGKIYLVSYCDYNYDGRLRGLMEVFSELGTLYSFTRGTEHKNPNYRFFKGNYLNFIKEAIHYGKNLGKFDCIVVVNRKASIPGIILKKKIQPTVMIQDCYELYISKERKHFVSKLGCFFEKQAINRADIVICANAERAEIMQNLYSLREKPIVYENLHQLQYKDECSYQAAKKRMEQYIKKGELRIVSSSGCSISRMNDILVENLSKMDKICRLFLVGENNPKEEKKIRDIIEKKQLKNVEILGRLSQDELKFLIANSHIGIVNYNQKDANNKYCASGKLYEFLYEGIPVVTTTNPPLKRLCDNEKIGVADDNYYKGIVSVIENYDYYKEKVYLYSNNHTVANNDELLKKQLIERIK